MTKNTSQHDKKKDRRTSMVFVISFHRSGTQSIHAFLKQAGYKSIHNPSGRSQMDFQSEWLGYERDLDYIFSNLISHTVPKYSAISDNPMAALYVQAFETFPESKFILTIRDPNKWIASVRKHIGNRKFVPAEKVQYWKYLEHTPERLSEIDDQTLYTLYRTHQEKVLDFFTKTDALDQLCVIDLEKSEEVNGNQLSTFLNVSPPIPMFWVDEKK